MQFMRYTHGNGPHWGVRDGDTVYDIEVGPDPISYEQFSNQCYREKLTDLISYGTLPDLDATAVTPLAPVPQPSKIAAAGLNYYSHGEEADFDSVRIDEADGDVPDEPFFFSKAPSSVTDPYAPIIKPPGVTQLDYEVELAVVIGRTLYQCTESVTDYIAGYTIINDVSARDAMEADGQFFRGKGYDSFTPMGPVIVTGDTFDPSQVRVECRVNGEVRQQSSTNEFVFSVEELLVYLSQVMTLRPGDVVSTGTPGGVGLFMNPPNFLESGDVVETEIEGIGTLRNTVVAG